MLLFLTGRLTEGRHARVVGGLDVCRVLTSDNTVD